MNKPNIIRLEEVASTNSYALDNLPDLNDKTVISAESQTAGRGRFNRKWVSDGSKNIYMSFVLKPSKEKYPYKNITQYLSVIVCGVLEEEYKIIPSIKWPNDIVVNGAKIAGILCEAKNRNGSINALVLGLGLNVNMDSESLNGIEQRATSLKVLLNKEIDVDDLVNKIAYRFFENYDLFLSEGFDSIKQDYIKKCDFIGKNIKISSVNHVSEVMAYGISDDGELIVSDSDGNLKNVITGDLTYC